MVFVPVRELSSSLPIREIHSPTVLCKLGGTWFESLSTIWGIIGVNCSILDLCLWTVEA